MIIGKINSDGTITQYEKAPSTKGKVKKVGQKVVGGLAKAGEYMGFKPFAQAVSSFFTAPYVNKMAEESLQQNIEGQKYLQQLAETIPKGDTVAREKLLRLIQQSASQGKQPAELLESFAKEVPSRKEAVGSSALIGLTAMAPGISRYNVPFKVGTRLLSMSRAAELGGMFGAAHAMSLNKEPVDIAKEAGVSALLAAPLPMIAAMFEQFYKFTKTLPEKFYSQMFKATHDDLEMELRTLAAGKQINPTLAREMVDRGVVGSNEGMAVYSLKKVNNLEQQIQQLLPTVEDVPIPINKKEVVSVLGSIKDGYKDMLRADKATEATQLIKSIKGNTVTPQTALTIRRFIDEARSQSAFKLHPTLSIKQGAYKTVADSIRNELRNNLPQFKELIGEEKIFLNAFDSLVDAAVKSRNVRLINLTDVLLGGGGLVSGFPGAGLGAMAGVRAFQMPQVLTRFAQGIEKGVVPAMEKAGPILKELGERAYYQKIK